MGDVPKDENGIPFDSVEGQTRTLGGQLMTALMASVLKEPVNRMRQEVIRPLPPAATLLPFASLSTFP